MGVGRVVVLVTETVAVGGVFVAVVGEEDLGRSESSLSFAESKPVGFDEPSFRIVDRRSIKGFLGVLGSYKKINEFDPHQADSYRGICRLEFLVQEIPNGKFLRILPSGSRKTSGICCFAEILF